MSSNDESPAQSNRQENNNLANPSEENQTRANLIADLLVDADFEDWYKRYQFAENIRNDQPYFNGPSKLKSPGKFSASELLKCHRKIYYKHLNAPEETADPKGIFYFGNKFEEELAERFIIDAVTEPDTYLRNSIWTQLDIDTDIGTIKVNGSTDPTVADENGEPILLTEIKTSSSIEYRSEPQERHLAQAHVYMQGLSEKFESEIRDAIFLYADRESLQAKTFHVEFDQEFWEDRVVEWMRKNTYYRLFEPLPPAEPEEEWECDYCAYQNRCGQTSERYEDEAASGLLPLYTEYPRDKVVEYVESHAGAKLTPSLAHKYPELADQYDVFDWQCSNCDTHLNWDAISWDGDEAPRCPLCEAGDESGTLSGPAPAEQHQIDFADQTEEESQ
jgi:CRISPR-associated exonuclease Cas4